jgi:hypothetical protein
MPNLTMRKPSLPTDGRALEQVFADHCPTHADETQPPPCMLHVFQCGMVSEAALKDLLDDSRRRARITD